MLIFSDHNKSLWSLFCETLSQKLKSIVMLKYPCSLKLLRNLLPNNISLNYELDLIFYDKPPVIKLLI